MVMVQDMIQAHLAHLNLVCPLTFWCYNLNILINHYSAKAVGLLLKPFAWQLDIIE